MKMQINRIAKIRKRAHPMMMTRMVDGQRGVQHAVGQAGMAVKGGDVGRIDGAKEPEHPEGVFVGTGQVFEEQLGNSEERTCDEVKPEEGPNDQE
jgi:hypothetical protein